MKHNLDTYVTIQESSYKKDAMKEIIIKKKLETCNKTVDTNDTNVQAISFKHNLQPLKIHIVANPATKFFKKKKTPCKRSL